VAFSVQAVSRVEQDHNVNMPLQPYTNTLVDCTVKPDTASLKGKSVVVTGGEPCPASLLFMMLTMVAG
jgi:organic radical activating enzyme